MADIGFTFLFSWFLIFAGSVVQAGEYCTDDDGFRTWCSNDCCGPYYDEYCCPDIDVSGITGAFTTAAIIGIVIGSLFFLAIIVGTIIAIYCCLKGRRAHGGAVYGGNTRAVTTVVTTGGQGMPIQSTAQAYPQGAYPTTSYPPTSYQPGQPMAGYPTGNIAPPPAGEKPPPYQ